MKLRDTPIKHKVMSVIMTTCTVVLLLMCVSYMTFEYFSFKQALKKNVATLGDVIASNSSAALAFQSSEDANEILGALRADPHIVAACLYDDEGNIFAKYPADASLNNFPKETGEAGYHFEDSHIEGYHTVMQENRQLGTLYIKSDLEAMYAQLRRYALIGLMLIGGALIVAYILSQQLQKTISNPILSLERAAKSISEKGDYSVRAGQYGEDEIGALTKAFNQMLAQIETQNHEITSFNQKLELKVRERTLTLQQQKDFIETIINSSVDLVSVFDTNLNYMMLNKRAYGYYEMQPENIMGKNVTDVFPEVANSGMHADLLKALEGEPVYNPKYKFPLLNKYFENYYIPLIDKDNKIYGVLTISHDITGIRETNEKLETLNAELLKSNRDLEQFAYVASHDLQEPLRKIQTFTQLLVHSISNEEKVKTFSEKINQSAARMQNLIQDVLNFSRVSKTEEAFVTTDLNKILENIKTDFELILGEKEVVINHDVLPFVKGIPLQLSQLFSNIISNAIKYNDKKAVIDISVDKVAAAEIKQHPKLNIKVKYIKLNFTDNGIGFEPQFSEQIFNIFQRLHGKQSYSGTGIGLAICKKIVENHHGVIYAKGKLSTGSVFSVILPA